MIIHLDYNELAFPGIAELEKLFFPQTWTFIKTSEKKRMNSK